MEVPDHLRGPACKTRGSYRLHGSTTAHLSQFYRSGVLKKSSEKIVVQLHSGEMLQRPAAAGFIKFVSPRYGRQNLFDLSTDLPIQLSQFVCFKQRADDDESILLKRGHSISKVTGHKNTDSSRT